MLPAPPVPSAERWVALDVVRGMTVAGMLLVNNPGTWSAIYPPLRHAEWHGWTPTDLIFPFFLFIVGITTELSLGRRAAGGADDAAIRRKILGRGLAIVGLGLLLTAFPFFPVTRFTEIRIPGVLQRIGVCYALSALFAWRRSDRAVGLGAAVLLLGYWLILTRGPLDAPGETVAARIDRLLLDGHLWSQSKTWDPEGPLSTIPAIGTSLLGILAGRWLRSDRPRPERLTGLFGWGVVGLTAGIGWGWVFPINKSLWTSSYVLVTAGAAALALATVTWLIEVRGWRRAVGFFVSYGRNPLLAFLGSGAMAKLLGLIEVPFRGGTAPLKAVVFESLFAPWLPPPVASLGFALGFVLVWYLILHAVERRGWILKV